MAYYYQVIKSHPVVATQGFVSVLPQKGSGQKIFAPCAQSIRFSMCGADYPMTRKKDELLTEAVQDAAPYPAHK